jgi:hypothetical protein
MDAHIQKTKKKIRKQKIRYGISALAVTIHPPPRQHLNSSISKSGVTSQNVGQFRGRLEGLLCISSEITGFFRAFASKT